MHPLTQQLVKLIRYYADNLYEPQADQYYVDSEGFVVKVYCKSGSRITVTPITPCPLTMLQFTREDFNRQFTRTTAPETPVYLVHRGGVEQATQLPSGKVRRKGRLENWEPSRVFTSESAAYDSLVARLTKQRDDIKNQIARITYGGKCSVH